MNADTPRSANRRNKVKPLEDENTIKYGEWKGSGEKDVGMKDLADQRVTGR
jgi:hypothetical protein